MVSFVLAIALAIAVFGGGFTLAVAGFIREKRKIGTDELSRRFSFTPRDRLVVAPRKGTYFIGAMLGSAVAAPLAMLVAQGMSDQPAIPILLLLGAIYFVVHNLLMLFWKGPILLADQNGIQYRRWSGAVIPWRAIVALKRYEYKEGERIMISVDPAYQGRGIKNRLASRKGISAMYVNLADTDHRLGHLLAVFRVHRPDLYNQVAEQG